MNRPSFLSTLPFLHGIPSSEWPPTISEDTGKTRWQFLFQDHCLSLEAISPDTEESLGPIWFMPPPDRKEIELFDHTMSTVEMGFFTTPKKTPYKMSRTPSKSPGSKKGFEVEFKEYIAFLRIDGRVYQLDLKTIKELELKESEAAAKGNHPPCLLIQFPNCFFRIFSLTHQDIDLYPILKRCKDEIFSALHGDNHCPFPMRELDLTSPMASTGPSSEPGQQESALQQHQVPRPSSEDTSRKSTKSDVDVGKQCREKTEKCLASRNAAMEDLKSLQEFMTSPGFQRPTTQSEELETITKASNLVTSVADNVGASFCTHEEVVTAVTGFDKEIHDIQNQMDKLLKTVWGSAPRKRPQKRQRGSSSTKRSADPPLQPQVQEAAIEHVELLLARHKKALQSKYALATLPTRG